MTVGARLEGEGPRPRGRRGTPGGQAASHDGLVPLQQSLTSVQRFLGALRPDALATLRASWTSLVGSRLAAACELHSVRDGCMVVETVEPAVAEQLRWAATDLVAAANAVLGSPELREVRVCLLRPRTSS